MLTARGNCSTAVAVDCIKSNELKQVLKLA
jgi:hypothetical protein